MLAHQGTVERSNADGYRCIASCPPATAMGRRQGTRGGLRRTSPPPHPSPPRPADGRRPARGTAAPHPPERTAAPRGGRHIRGERHRVRSAGSQPPTHFCSARRQPAALRRRSRVALGPLRWAPPRNAARRAGHSRSKLPWCPHGESGGTERDRETSPPPTPRSPAGEPPGIQRTGSSPPPAARLTHRRPARPRPAPGGARQARLNIYTKGGCAGEERGLGRRPQTTFSGQGGEEPRRDPPPLSPPPPPPACGPRGRQPSPPSEAEGPRSLHNARCHAPQRTPTTTEGGTRTQTGAVWGPRPP